MSYKCKLERKQLGSDLVFALIMAKTKQKGEPKMNEEATHFRIYCCGNVNCLARDADDIWRVLDEQIWLAKLSERVELRRSGCQDHCDFGPNIQIWPGPYRYVELTPAKIKQIVRQHLLAGQPVEELLAKPHMRRQTGKDS